jgi:mRNA interferase MazF
VRRGEVWWYEEPDEAPRPWLILTRDQAIDGLQKLLAAPATRTVRGIPTEVPIGPEDGMPVDCVLSLDNTTPIAKVLLRERIATLDPAKLADVCRALNAAISCSLSHDASQP